MDGTESRDQDDQPVLRVNQLDSHQLDDEIHHLLKAQVTKVFQFFQPGVLSRIEPEVNAGIRFVIWKFSIENTSSTLGQQLLNLKYGRVWDRFTMSSRQRWLYAFAVITLKWFQERTPDLTRLTSSSQRLQIVWRILDLLEHLFQILSLINFLVFLQRGTYQTILERLLGIRAKFASPQSIRPVSFEFMTRELLWHGFAEFLFFLLPFVNFQKIKNVIRRQLQGKYDVSRESGEADSRPNALYKECTICGEWPVLPQEIGCQHVFCYYCIQANFAADSNYTCQSCGFPVADADNIKPVMCDVR